MAGEKAGAADEVRQPATGQVRREGAGVGGHSHTRTDGEPLLVMSAGVAVGEHRLPESRRAGGKQVELG